MHDNRCEDSLYTVLTVEPLLQLSVQGNLQLTIATVKILCIVISKMLVYPVMCFIAINLMYDPNYMWLRVIIYILYIFTFIPYCIFQFSIFVFEMDSASVLIVPQYMTINVICMSRNTQPRLKLGYIWLKRQSFCDCFDISFCHENTASSKSFVTSMIQADRRICSETTFKPTELERFQSVTWSKMGFYRSMKTF